MKKNARRSLLTAATAVVAGTALAAGLALAGEPAAAPETAESGPQAVESAAGELDFSTYEFTGFDRLIADTDYLAADYKVNPHNSHMGQIANCGVCHGHAEDGGDELFCTSCHVGFHTADDWGAYEVSVWG